MQGDEIPELAAFSPKTARWNCFSLEIPATDAVRPIIGDWVVGVNVKGRAYAFSSLTETWDVTQSDALAGAEIGKIFSRHQDKTSVFRAETGKWADRGDFGFPKSGLVEYVPATFDFMGGLGRQSNHAEPGHVHRQPNKQGLPPFVMSGASAAVVIPRQQPSALAAYSMTAGKWSLYTPSEGVRVTPVTGGHVFGLIVNGDRIPELAAFSPKTARWHRQKLDTPAKGLVHAAVEDWVVGINVNGRAYAFSGLTGNWDVTDIDAPVAVDKTQAFTWRQGKAAVFSVETGKWKDASDSLTAGPPQPGVPLRKQEDIRIFDDFDDQLQLDWQLLRPDPTHISLSKHPGSLTISTQKGTIHLKGKPKAKNILLLDNPYPEGPGFVVTTCLDGFYPREPYQQAGLIVYNDDDNYLKWVIEQTTSGGIPNRVAWNLLRENNGSSSMAKPGVTHNMTKKVWLRLTLRKNQYEYASSTDGEKWTAYGELPWGDGRPKQIGLIAKDGGMRAADTIDACFDFFEIRLLTPAERKGTKSRTSRIEETCEPGN
jgi:regulation of enolase protein 1 (concanavalin A-like superfamily)